MDTGTLRFTHTPCLPRLSRQYREYAKLRPVDAHYRITLRLRISLSTLAPKSAAVLTQAGLRIQA